MKLFGYLVLLSLTLSCSSKGHVILNFPQDPVLTLSENLNNIVIINRSLTKNNSGLEPIISGEIVGSDKIASQEALKGVFAELQNRGHYQIKIPDTTQISGAGTKETQDILNWESVQEICNKTNADVLLALETFDSNSDFILKNAINQVSSVIKTGKPSTHISKRARVSVTSFWRLYNPKNKTILDQFQQTFFMEFDLENDLIPFFYFIGNSICFRSRLC